MKLQADNLSKAFGSLKVVQSLSLNVPQGQMFCILGPSGCGKSTLLNVISGLLEPNQGIVKWDDSSLYQLSHAAFIQFRAENFSHIFQHFHLLPHLTAFENARLPLHFREAEDIENKTRLALETVGLLDRMDHYPHQLSRGERQRLAIARALTYSPKVLFADEPTASLDPVNARHIFEILKKLTPQCTVITVTHDWELAKLADVTMEMRSGALHPFRGH